MRADPHVCVVLLPSVLPQGKDVLLVDDSIVRGTTMTQIVDMVRKAGARKVYLASASPPIRFPNVYGVDMPSRKEFVANGLTVEQVRESCLGNSWFGG